jgi:hypothetical protein
VGDRVLIQIVGRNLRLGDADNSVRFSPVAYGHWCGSDTPAIVARLRERMKSRPGDVDYTFARLIQEMTDGDTGALSFGVWNADHVLTESDSHGDAGCVVIDVSQGFQVRCFGGYLTEKGLNHGTSYDP